MKIAAFTKYDREAASTRQRILQYIPALEAAGFTVDHYPLLGAGYVRSLVTGERPNKWPIVKAYASRLRQLLNGAECDVLWVYAELFPYLPAGIETLAFRHNRPLVYDFDDAFHTVYDEHPHWWLRTALGGKLEPLIAGASTVCCGNSYLHDYARRLNDHCVILPTVVDTDVYRPERKLPVRVIGWIGSPSTWPNVRPLLPLLAQICRDHDVRFRVIGAGKAAMGDRFAGMELVEWSEATEVSEVQRMDVGIMPLLDLPFQRGKSGYKLVQYMACGLPVVASPVGVNRDIVADGTNGFLAATEDEWRKALEKLIRDPDLRARMGAAGRRQAEQNYSLKSQEPRLVEIFRDALERRQER